MGTQPGRSRLAATGAGMAVGVRGGSRGLGNAAPLLPAVPGKVGAAPGIRRDDCLIPLSFPVLALRSSLV